MATAWPSARADAAANELAVATSKEVAAVSSMQSWTTGSRCVDVLMVLYLLFRVFTDIFTIGLVAYEFLNKIYSKITTIIGWYRYWTEDEKKDADSDDAKKKDAKDSDIAPEEDTPPPAQVFYHAHQYGKLVHLNEECKSLVHTAGTTAYPLCDKCRRIKAE